MKLYKVEELKQLNINDDVNISYKDDEDYFKSKSIVVDKTPDTIYFNCDYGTFDFPLEHSPDVETEYAIIDNGEYVFKVFK